MDEIWVKLQDFAAEYGLQVLGAIIIFLVGRWIAKVLRNLVRRLMKKAKVDLVLVSFVGQLVYVVLMVFIIIAILNNLGVATTSFIAVVGAAGLAVGLALQGSLANFAAGVLLIIFRPLRVGDFVEGGGQTGTVEEVGIFTTQLVTPDNRLVTVPNAKLTGDNIVNYTERGTRRVDLVVGVSYGDDLKKVKKVIADQLSKDDRILAEPAPTIGVVELGDSSINFAVRPWCDATEYWNVHFDTLEALKTRFDKEDISIPFPQHDVHMIEKS